ncbi:MAG: glycosyltransferase [Bacteroidales bacterium]|nr:glycosyltransferase [Bacteroidales bacterium]
MDLSVIIVNYNVKYFLEQCLHSVYKSIEGIHCEIIVVDNNSVDGSCQMIREKFPEVILVENKKNYGFSKANNQGLAIAKGKYLLMLNPDTIVQEDTFSKCISFMDNHSDAGGLGVKMIDGKGNFLPESKRALPTPLVSFFKIFGLSRLFPRSKLFGKYHLGYLDNNKISKIEILPGAFMFIRKNVLDKTGYLDEAFFMYGEDIDLSYRIILAGYNNYYFPETTIIHYKGESTKKGSINYVMVFYKAMIIFAKKHFSAKNAFLFSALINLAIYLRASLSIFRRFFLKAIVPLSDAFFIYFGFYFFEPFWEKIKFGMDNYYPEEYLKYVVPAYILLWFFFLFIAGAYEKRTRIVDLLKGISMGTIALFIIYALLPESLRYSRALLLLGTVWATVSVFLTRITVGKLFHTVNLSLSRQKKRIIIAGSLKESNRVFSIMKQTNIVPNLVGIAGINGKGNSESYIGDLSQLNEIVKINRIDEIVFCAKDIPSHKIIQTMLSISDPSIDYKIAPPESLSIIGSNSINTAGELYIVHFNSLSQGFAQRTKRLFDILVALILLLILPVALFIVRNPLGLIRNIFLTLTGFRTWIGFYPDNEAEIGTLPKLNKGILTPIPGSRNKKINSETIKRMNLLYAKDYKMSTDISIIFRDFRYLGR